MLELHIDDVHGCAPPHTVDELIEDLKNSIDLKTSDAIVAGRYDRLKKETDSQRRTLR